MGGVAKTVGRVSTGIITGGMSEIGRAVGGDKIKNLMGKVDQGVFYGGLAATGLAAAGPAGIGLLGKGAGAAAAGSGVSGTTAAVGQGGAGVMAQAGGVPLLTKVLLGGSVATTLAGYFGRKPGEDYNQFIDSLDPSAKAEVDKLTQNLTEIQSNLDLRNQAVQKLVDDFPNVVAQVHADRAKAGEEFDSVSAKMMDQVSNQLAAKYASTGGFSSGAFNQGLASKAGDIAMDKLNYMGNRENASWQQNMAGYSARLAEVESLRDFQRSMLGLGTQERFSAAQAALASGQQNNRLKAQLGFQQNQANNQADQQLFGSLGNTLGTAAMMPLYAQMFNPNKAAAAQSNVVGSSIPSWGSELNLNGPRIKIPGFGGY